MQFIPDIPSIISRYDALLLDLWGVVHDGSQLYPGVHETLIRLRQADKKIIMLSNAPRRAYRVEKVLNGLGVGPELYDHVVTSGELGYAALYRCQSSENGCHIPFLTAGIRHPASYYYIGPSKDADVLDGLEYRRSDDLKDSDFLLNVGFGDHDESAEDWQPLLHAAKALDLSMLCLNPDFEVVKITGERYACAGVLAADYERLGGKVTYFGKPFPEVYAHCLGLLKVEKEKILAIGDGIATDIAGAANFGIDAALVTGGIIKKSDNVEELCRKHDVSPKYLMSGLRW